MSSEKQGNNSYNTLENMGPVSGPIKCGEYSAFRFSEDEEGQMSLIGNGKIGHSGLMYFRKKDDAWIETWPLTGETPKRFNGGSKEYKAFEELLRREIRYESLMKIRSLDF